MIGCYQSKAPNLTKDGWAVVINFGWEWCNSHYKKMMKEYINSKQYKYLTVIEKREKIGRYSFCIVYQNAGEASMVEFDLPYYANEVEESRFYITAKNNIDKFMEDK